jgi:hypothetical protein
VCLHFVFSRLDRWVFGWESTTDGGGRFCYFAGFFEAIRLKMSDEGDIWRDPKGKSISRGEKRRMEAEAEGLVFQGPRGLIMMELSQARNVRLLFLKHYTSGSKKFLLRI